MSGSASERRIVRLSPGCFRRAIEKEPQQHGCTNGKGWQEIGRGKAVGTRSNE
ncbi:hypothetical protein SAMN05660831_00114 [Thiohalospira halophila DSM 15071]|uniref:Uncharacterized protein n=1 Tax=Thiohalospira halophila DSM 15071 TaxID=1123397 RepID=A0A1I1N5B8_9GAMM|nr:hypothetical protein SAMN05660831_00114 [Thiohalospira halophila DSM 15071]